MTEKRVPKLRFREFHDEWKEASLSSVSNYVKGYAFKTSDYEADGIRIIRVSDLTENKIKPAINAIFINHEKEITYNSYMLTCEDIIITTVGSKPELIESAVGRAILINQGSAGLLNQNMLKLIVNKKLTCQLFIFYQLNTKRYTNHIKNIQRGNANQSNITVSNLMEYRIGVTNLQEQQKIADFLSSVDEKITLLQKQKTAWGTYKKGMMQQIFSQKIRFKDDKGQEFPSWEEKKFGAIFCFFRTNSYSRDNLNYEKGLVKNIHYGDIHTKFNHILNIDKEISRIPFINEKINLSKFDIQDYCQQGDLIFADASEDNDGIGKCVELVNLGTFKILAGLHTILARPRNKNGMASGFSTYLMSSQNVRKKIFKESQGAKVLGLSARRLSTIELKISHFNEQQKIADFLSSLDDKIAAIGMQISAAQQWKKGLMQQMFV